MVGKVHCSVSCKYKRNGDVTAIFQQHGGEKMIDLNKYQNEINRICQNNHVKRLTAFGSVLSEQFDESSDIDFLLELETTKGGIIR